MKTNSETLNRICAEINAEDKTFFEHAFTDAVTKRPYDIPPDLRRLAERICRSYGIRGSCDPMYIANVIAFELGLGDGKSNFFKTPKCDFDKNLSDVSTYTNKRTP